MSANDLYEEGYFKFKTLITLYRYYSKAVIAWHQYHRPVVVENKDEPDKFIPGVLEDW